jgi:hypothetical protein
MVKGRWDVEDLQPFPGERMQPFCSKHIAGSNHPMPNLAFMPCGCCVWVTG